MDLLEFGMQNSNSESLVRRTLARAVLAAERKRADDCERRLEEKLISIPEDPEADAALLQKIREQIEGEGRE